MPLAICSVKAFSGSPDKNGMEPIILTPVAGKVPFKRVISGTVAQREGLEVGKSYLLDWNYEEDDEQYGTQVRYSNCGQVSTMEVIQASKDLGNGVVLEDKKVATPELV